MENYVGIDLGTTNSAICTFNKETQQTRVWKSPEQNDVTPSAIYINKSGREQIGYSAFNAAPRSPDNCATLFKRLMGTNTPIELSVVNKTFTPEECSAKVLKTLFGYLPEEIRTSSETGTVVTVPAAFNQMQKNATFAAAEMAGIGKVELVQEPVSAVMSYMKASGGKDGIFLVYDLGGGTLDIAVSESIRKRVTILAHGGIQMCGGRDFDRMLVDNIVRPWLHENFDLPDDLAANPTFKPLLRLVTWATEKAKIELSSKDESMISLSEEEIRTNDLNGDEIYLEIPLHRDTFEKLIEEQIDETIDAAREILLKTGYSPNDIECIVWVGGPTHYRPLRDKVAFELGIKGDILTVNPMTAVAEGAGIWAESVDWTSAKGKKGTKPENINVASKSSDEKKFIFKYNERTPDNTTKIALQVEGQVPSGYKFQVNSLDSGWTSGQIPLQHGAAVDVNLTEPGENKYSCTVYDEMGNTKKQEEIAIRKVDISMDKIPAELSIALELISKVGGEPELKYLIEEGELLPKKGEITVYAAESLDSGSSKSLNFKFREIDALGKDTIIAILKVKGEDFANGTIPVNAPLKCFYEKTLGGYIKFEVEVEIEGIRKTFNEVLYRDDELTPDLDQIAERAMQVTARIDRIEKLVGPDPELDKARKKVESALTIDANESDPDKVLRAYQDILTAEKLIDQVEKKPENINKIRQIDLDEIVKFFDLNIRQFARSSEAAEFDKLVETAQRSIDNNHDDFNDHLSELRGRNFQILWRQDWFVIERYKWLTSSRHLFANKDRFEELVHIGNSLIAHQDIQDILSGKRVATIKSEVVDQLRQIVIQMMDILRDSRGLSPDDIADITNILEERTNIE